MEKILAVDVGGTNIKYATWDGKLSTVKEVPTPLDKMKDFLDVMEKILKEVGPVKGIGFSYPGFIDPETGIKHGGGNIRYTDKVSITELIKENFGLEAAIENDSRSATLAELDYGSLKDVNDAVMLVLGTGVGGTVVIDKKILRGPRLVAGEFSFLSDDIHQPGDMAATVAAACSTTGLIAIAEDITGETDLDGRKIFERINKGDIAMTEALKIFCKNLCWLIFNLQLVVDPELVAIGGGISSQPVLIETLKKEISEYYDKNCFGIKPPEITVCKFGNDANLIGAALNFEKHFGEK